MSAISNYLRAKLLIGSLTTKQNFLKMLKK